MDRKEERLAKKAAKRTGTAPIFTPAKTIVPPVIAAILVVAVIIAGAGSAVVFGVGDLGELGSGFESTSTSDSDGLDGGTSDGASDGTGGTSDTGDDTTTSSNAPTGDFTAKDGYEAAKEAAQNLQSDAELCSVSDGLEYGETDTGLDGEISSWNYNFAYTTDSGDQGIISVSVGDGSATAMDLGYLYLTWDIIPEGNWTVDSSSLKTEAEKNATVSSWLNSNTVNSVSYSLDENPLFSGVEGTAWYISYTTSDYHTLYVYLDAKTGDVLEVSEV